MKHLAGILGSIAIVAMLVSVNIFYAKEESSEAKTTPTEDVPSETVMAESISVSSEPIISSKVQWISFEEALERNKENPRKIFIDVYTDWCGWCKRMDKNTFENEKVATLLNEKYYAVKLDAEQKEDIEFDGRTFKFVPEGRNGYHELAASLLNGKMSYPTVVFLDEEFRLITPVPGYQQPQDLHPILQFIGDSHYKNTEWESFIAQYKSPF